MPVAKLARIRALRLVELVETPTAVRPARKLEHNRLADGLLADVETGRALSVHFQGAAMQLAASCYRRLSMRAFAKPKHQA